MTGGPPPKYPIVLVHGIIAHDRPGVIKYWGRIPETLQEEYPIKKGDFNSSLFMLY